MEEDYYKTLGLNRNASDAEIQKAYRNLARKYHPDVNPDDESAKQKFQEIQTAYDVLSNSEKREMYDRYGSSFESMGGGPGGAGGARWTYQGGPEGFQEVDFSQIFGGAGGDQSPFGDFFRNFSGGSGNGPRPRSRPRKGADLAHELTVSFRQAVVGGVAQLTVQRPSGKIETITVKIPAGIEDGKSIRLRGQGEKVPEGSGTSGDLLIKIRVAPHPCFRRRGRDLEVDVPVTLAEAALGSKVDVPTPQGVISLTIPAGTSSGKRFRVKGHGVATGSGEKGDLFAEIRIVLPKKLNDASNDLIREFDQLNPLETRQDLQW